jgi:hypothetical protein
MAVVDPVARRRTRTLVHAIVVGGGLSCGVFDATQCDSVLSNNDYSV